MPDKIQKLQEMSDDFPVHSDRVVWAEFLELTGIHPSRLGELLEMGWIDPEEVADEQYLFTRKDVYRVRKLTRICDDFGLNQTGGSIIVDLLERVEHLERKVQELELLSEG